MQTKDKSIIISMMLLISLMFVGSASASTCTDAGDFEGICTVLTDIANASLVVVSILFTGDNASVIIEAVIIIAIVVFFIDLSRGKSSWVRGRFNR